MLQLFCGPLTGASPIPARGSDYGLCFLQLQPDLFHGRETTDSGVKQILSAVMECTPAEWHEIVRLPGAASRLALEQAEARGLGVDRELRERAGELAGL
jgi:LDH2 family malate/lactate/ureidoglycolate dehydrogenase